jgi:hypothetical protein
MNELRFLNFCISFSKRLSSILDAKIIQSKKHESLDPEDEALLKLLYTAMEQQGMEFGNENRNHKDLRAGEQK